MHLLCRILVSPTLMYPLPHRALASVCAAVCSGVVPLVARLLTGEQLEVSVRSLMVLGMLCSSNHTAQQQLADQETALQQLMLLLKQQEDLDCKVRGAFVDCCPVLHACKAAKRLHAICQYVVVQAIQRRHK